MAINPALIRIPGFRDTQADNAPAADVTQLAEWVRQHPRLLVLTGAGCSSASGIPTYRDRNGAWLRRDPIMYQDFIGSAITRRRYWARSFLGWPVMQRAEPNGAHRALAALAERGNIGQLITQNVDGLHQRAGHAGCINLHGTLDEVKCLGCDHRLPRDVLQQQLKAANDAWQAAVIGINPDGDAELDEQAYPGFNVVNCEHCGGPLKPDVVFFGESVPLKRMQQVNQALGQCEAVLTVGTSLVVWSGYRIVRDAAAKGLPAVAVNNGRTRADGLLRFKLTGDCDEVLPRLLEAVALF